MIEFFPEQALEQARELDEYFEKHKKPIGPLHGLPISLKDQFRVRVRMFLEDLYTDQLNPLTHWIHNRGWKRPWDMSEG